MKDVIIIGTGGHAKVLADIVLRAGDGVLGFLTAERGRTTFLDRPVLGLDTDIEKYREHYLLIAVGDPNVRERLAGAAAGVRWYTAIHPAAVVSPMGTDVGEGSVIMANATVNPCARIGRHCIVNSGATVEHDNVIRDFAHISVGAKLSGNVEIGERTWVGAGATVSNGLRICRDCMIGAGAVVIRDITVPGTYVGVPARKIK